VRPGRLWPSGQVAGLPLSPNLFGFFFCFILFHLGRPAFAKRALKDFSLFCFFISFSHFNNILIIRINILSNQKAPACVSNTVPELLNAWVQHYNFADNSLPALNLATFLALILITAPV
jgi:hypothetical protein